MRFLAREVSNCGHQNCLEALVYIAQLNTKGVGQDSRQDQFVSLEWR